MQRRSFVQALAALPCACACGVFAQDKFPTGPITIVVPYAPGGNVDSMARLVSVPLGKALGQPIIIDNRPGAGGVIGTDYVARSTPNGYTLVCTANGSLTVAPRMIPKRPFTAKNFVAVGGIGSTPMVIAAPAKGRFKTFPEMLAFAKAHPEEVTLAHSGNGTTNHIAILRLQEVTGARFTIVAYKGSAPALNDLLGGQIDGLVDQVPSSLPHIKAQKLLPLAVTSKAAIAELPGVNSLTELGYPKLDITTVTGLLAPAKTPRQVVDDIHRALSAALGNADVQKRLKDIGAQPITGTLEQYAEFIATEDQSAETLFAQGLLKPE